MPKCESCGSHVSESFARVFGGQDNRVGGCLRCGGTQLSARETALDVLAVVVLASGLAVIDQPAYWGVIAVAGVLLVSSRLRRWWLA